MEYVEFRVRVHDTKRIQAWLQNSPPVDGEVTYGALQRQTVKVLTRWVAEDKIRRRDELAILGSHLYGVLFDGDVDKEFRKAYEKKGEATLRVVLEFFPAARDLATLPWEYLHVPDDDKRGSGFFIATQNRLILSRHVPLQVEDEVLKPQRSSLRVLAVVSRPVSERVEEERDGEVTTVNKPMGIVNSEPVIEILEELQRASDGRIEVQKLEQPDKKSFGEALNVFRPHVVHFIGHGRYRNQVGALAFTQKTKGGNAEALWLNDTDFTDFFRAITPPRLIFLQACDGARSDSYEAFSGVSLQLVYSRMPAVIAMQYPISNQMAIAFVRSLYGELSAGAAIDEAVQKGRNELGVYLDEQNFSSRAFGSPVVFLQSKDARSLEGIVIGEPSIPASLAAAPASQQTYRCPNPACRNLINPDRKVCPTCRTQFKFCPFLDCGQAIFSTAAFCDACNRDVDAAPPLAPVARLTPATPVTPATSLSPGSPVMPIADPSRRRRF